MTDHRPAPLPLRWWLRVSGFRGITMPWHRAYYWPWPADPGLVAHEQVHLDQLARLGPVRFVALYLWLLIRHGYEAHPMEREAREISGHR